MANKIISSQRTFKEGDSVFVIDKIGKDRNQGGRLVSHVWIEGDSQKVYTFNDGKVYDAKELCPDSEELQKTSDEIADLHDYFGIVQTRINGMENKNDWRVLLVGILIPIMFLLGWVLHSNRIN